MIWVWLQQSHTLYDVAPWAPYILEITPYMMMVIMMMAMMMMMKIIIIIIIDVDNYDDVISIIRVYFIC